MWPLSSAVGRTHPLRGERQASTLRPLTTEWEKACAEGRVGFHPPVFFFFFSNPSALAQPLRSSWPGAPKRRLMKRPTIIVPYYQRCQAHRRASWCNEKPGVGQGMAHHLLERPHSNLLDGSIYAVFTSCPSTHKCATTGSCRAGVLHQAHALH